MKHSFVALIFLVASVISLAAPATEVSMVKVKAQEESDALSKQVGGLILAKKFQELEALYAGNVGKYFDDGAISNAAFARYFDELDPQSLADVDRIGASLNEWVAAEPKSRLARGMQIDFFVHKAWWYRGGSWAKDVKKDKWAPFGENLRKAGELFEQCRAEDLESPLAWSAILTVAKGLNAGKSVEKELFEQAIKKFPHDKLIVPSRVDALQPRWGGSPGEWEKALLENFDIKDPANHLFIYKIASSQICREERYTFRPPLTWEALKACYNTAVKSMKDPLAFNNRQCRMAFDQGDYAEADRLFKKIRQYGSWSAWDSVEQFEKYRQIAAAKVAAGK